MKVATEFYSSAALFAVPIYHLLLFQKIFQFYALTFICRFRPLKGWRPILAPLLGHCPYGIVPSASPVLRLSLSNLEYARLQCDAHKL